VDLLQQLGLEQVVQLHFTQDFAAQTPPAFIETVLQEGLQVQQLSVGGDFCFGQRRSGNTATLVAWGQQRGVRVDVVPHMEWQDLKVSSSRIRAALATGDVETAAVLLGRPYKLEGVVVQGDQRGRLIGFPTANLSLPAEKVIPRDGVYSAWVWLEDHPIAQPAVMNIGIRPTVDGSCRTVEVHLLDWQGDLYGSLLKVDLHHFLRPEQKFASVQHLQEQILLDSQVARQLLGLIDVPQTAIQC
jgi:riboflavin kinase/FMN adenylyltransferase